MFNEPAGTCWYATLSVRKNNKAMKHSLSTLSHSLLYQVTWDDSEMLQLVRYVSPWNVKITSLTPVHHTIETPYITPLKRARTAACNIYENSAETYEMTSPTPPLHLTHTPFTTPSPKQLPTTSYNIYQHPPERFKPQTIVPFTLNHCTTFPAGMQGARHHHQHHLSVFTQGPSPPLTPNQVLPDNPLEGSSETGTEQSRSSVKNMATGTIMLFGKLIEFEQDSDEGVNKTGDEFFLPGFMEQKLEASIDNPYLLFH